ncbi:MAG: 50S ribosomal protein L6 [Planctomycetes bacterium]|jgi:large subunit ribosomal protein L6|nr:50S ribosomal protein L6 [Planctomycetota bacterium]
MSRIGKKPIPLPANIKFTQNGRQVSVEGPKGKLTWTHHERMSVRLDDATRSIVVERPDDERLSRSLHGLTRSLITNMIQGVNEGFRKDMELYGVGFSVNLQGKTLSLVCGFAHPVQLTVPDGVTVQVTTPSARGDSDPAKFSVSGIDKQAVGEFAARCRRVRKPEPYKGKGVRYAGERIVRKVGKAFAGAGG